MAFSLFYYKIPSKTNVKYFNWFLYLNIGVLSKIGDLFLFPNDRNILQIIFKYKYFCLFIKQLMSSLLRLDLCFVALPDLSYVPNILIEYNLIFGNRLSPLYFCQVQHSFCSLRAMNTCYGSFVVSQNDYIGCPTMLWHSSILKSQFVQLFHIYKTTIGTRFQFINQLRSIKLMNLLYLEGTEVLAGLNGLQQQSFSQLLRLDH